LNSQRNNNRRRGRGSNRGGSGNQSNRIDSRARGNAPQMLEKYKKLAHDASLNDDRVQTEYYLQFADHYFRVIADSKAQKDEQRTKRDGERDRDDDGDDDRDEGRGRNPRSRSARDDFDSYEPTEVQHAEVQHGAEGEPDDGDNPFVSKPAKKRGRKKTDDGDSGLNPDLLPPSIARDDDSGDEDRPRRPRGRKARADDGNQDALQEAD
jgi:hypothetical protein